ncbi:hypothetical protein ACWGS9_13830 [Bradyrhizobium sp. Arg314]
MTREQILQELRAGLLAAGFVAVDDLSRDEEIFLRAHSGELETDDTPLTHVNFAPQEMAMDVADVVSLIRDRIAGAVQSHQERVGPIHQGAGVWDVPDAAAWDSRAG